MTPRVLLLPATLALAALALTGCLPSTPTPGPAPETSSPAPDPIVTPTPDPTVAPEPEPTDTPVPQPDPTQPFDADALIDVVIGKDTAAIVAMLGDPIREVDVAAGSDASLIAADAQSTLTNILAIGETFKPAEPDIVAALASSSYPEFGAADAVVFLGSQGTVLSFIPGAFLRTTTG